MVKKILIAVVAVIIIAQFFRIDKTNPESDPKMDLIAITHPPERVKELLKTTCYDCHSNEVTYPWYTNIAPVSWIIKNHVNEGRGHLNFSIWGTYQEKKKDHKLEECYEEVEEKEMPLNQYTWLHKEANLSDEDRKLLVDWFKSLR